MKQHLQQLKRIWIRYDIHLMLMSLCMFGGAYSFAQSFTASLHGEPALVVQDENTKSLREILKAVEQQHHIFINYESSMLDDKFITQQEAKHILDIKEEHKALLEKAISKLLKPLNLRFKKFSDNNYIIIKELNMSTAQAGLFAKSSRNAFSRVVQLQQQTITGRVTDAETNEPLPGVNVLVKNTTLVISKELFVIPGLAGIPVE
jgi:hypothetical protein